MREIDYNNINKLNFKGIQKASNDAMVQPEAQQPAPAEQKEIKDLANTIRSLIAAGGGQLEPEFVFNAVKVLYVK